jgi:archaemetzincin
MLTKITLKPIGDIANDILEYLKERLKKTFGCPIEIIPQPIDLNSAYDPERGQYLAPALLAKLESQGALKDEKVLGIVDVDLYAPGLNFVFGQASTNSGISIMSPYRLNEQPADKAKFLGRATKEAVHELGHTFGLEHCTDPMCVMHFSNSLQDTDIKGATFCGHCRPKLIK